MQQPTSWERFGLPSFPASSCPALMYAQVTRLVLRNVVVRCETVMMQHGRWLAKRPHSAIEELVVRGQGTGWRSWTGGFTLHLLTRVRAQRAIHDNASLLRSVREGEKVLRQLDADAQLLAGAGESSGESGKGSSMFSDVRS